MGLSRPSGSWLFIGIGLLLIVGFVGLTWGLAAAAPPWVESETTYVGVQGPAEHGQVVALAPDGEVAWRVDRAGSYHDVTLMDDGRVLVTFASGESERCGAYNPPCARTGIRILEPDPANGSASIDAEWSYPVRTLQNSEVHDAEPLPNGRILVVGMDRERIFIVDPQTPTGNVTHVWNASSYYEPAPADPAWEDWLHLNDVDRLRDGRLLVSVRNRNQLLFLSRNGTVLDVVNQDGDPTVMRGQHNPQYLGDGAVLVADSGNDRVIELHRAPNGTWEPVWMVSGANGLSLAWPRDADRQPDGHTVITDSRNNRLIEVDRQGHVLGITRVPALPYEADLGGHEPASRVQLDGMAVPPGRGGSRLGLVGTLAIGLQHTVPLPYWWTEWHVLVSLVGLGCINAGIFARATERFRGWRR